MPAVPTPTYSNHFHSDSFHDSFTISFKHFETKAQKFSQGMRSNKPWVPVVCFGAGTVAAVPWTWIYHARRQKRGKTEKNYIVRLIVMTCHNYMKLYDYIVQLH